ncbi:MAG: type II secretion system ATPase GspE [Sedimenticola sp.]
MNSSEHGIDPAKIDTPPSALGQTTEPESPLDKLSAHLLASRLLSATQLERARQIHQETGKRLSTLLVKLGLVAERDLARALAKLHAITLAEPTHYKSADKFADRVSLDFLSQYQVLPVAEDDAGIHVVMSDPGDNYAITALELALDNRVVPIAGLGTDIRNTLSRLHDEDETAVDTMDDQPIAALDDIDHLRDMASEAPVIRMVNRLIGRAVEMKASDIHIEPFVGSLQVRYRIDGVLREIESPPSTSAAAVISRIKVMANLNIAQRRLPQDGRIKIRVEGREIDMRISTVPTLHGEGVVMRILDQANVPLDFAELGFDGENLSHLNKLLSRPQGIVLVTGPTGSGKTTTLYVALQQLNTPDKKILAVEDPVEYQLKGINQIQVRSNIDLTFANALRSILRQDPDIIMIGEMRDTETARIATQSALTGHKVLSTLHTNDAPSSITRLLDMHVANFLLTSTVDGVVAQRLVRRLCPHCREAFAPAPELIQTSGLHALADDDITLYRASGCSKCEHTGYRGRIAILEILLMSAAIRQAVIKHAGADVIRRIATGEGMHTLREDGLRKALAGLTTLEEVERVTQDEAEST